MSSNYKIKDILLDLVSAQSDTGTALEVNVANKILSYIKEDSYFSNHREYFGYEIGGDIFDRPVIWALRKGKCNKTIILSGHYDAVEIDCYGELKPYALSPDLLKEKLLKFPHNNELLKEQIKDSSWLFGRGTADMKAGLAIALHTLLTYEDPEVNILFTAVCDEENISAGTLVSLPLYLKLKDKFNLDYKLTVISEPQFDKSDGFVVYNGGSGKMLPMIVAKGKVAHCAQPLKGLNSVHMMAEIVRNIDLNPELTTEDLGVSTQVPVVQVMKDLKTTYDVSMADFTFACVNVLFLNSKNPPIIMEKIKKICMDSMDELMAKYEKSYAFSLDKNLIHPDDKPNFNIKVVSLKQLENIVKEIKPDYEEFKNALEKYLQEKVKGKEFTILNASVYYMQELIKASCITEPLVVVGLAAPYYPAVCNEYLNKDITFAKESIAKIVEQKYNLPLNFTPYFTGMGDISYMTCPNPELERELMSNITLPSSLYDIPFETIAEIDTPCLYLGPRCEDVHQWGERVYMPDVENIVPEILTELIKSMAYK
ncbi:MAG: M20/M25/M40 family metallo-hydrolase [Aminipila sp.]